MSTALACRLFTTNATHLTKINPNSLYHHYNKICMWFFPPLSFTKTAHSPSESVTCFNKLCFELKPEVVVWNSLLAIIRTKIAGPSLPLTSLVKLFDTTYAKQVTQGQQNFEAVDQRIRGIWRMFRKSGFAYFTFFFFQRWKLILFSIQISKYNLSCLLPHMCVCVCVTSVYFFFFFFFFNS